jgi:hypothetical protein
VSLDEFQGKIPVKKQYKKGRIVQDFMVISGGSWRGESVNNKPVGTAPWSLINQSKGTCTIAGCSMMRTSSTREKYEKILIG